MGGAVAAIDYMKRALVESNTERLRRIESGRADRGRRQPLDRDGGLAAVHRRGLHRGGRSRPSKPEQIERLAAWRAAARRQGGEEGAGRSRSAPPREGRNVMEPSIACAKAGVTTGEWGATLRGVFGEYRAPTGVSAGRGRRQRRRPRRRARRGGARVGAARAGASSCWSASPASTATPTAPSRSRCGRATAAWRWSTRASG